jgi:hypothetical protein
MVGIFILNFFGNYVGGSGRGPLERFADYWQDS